MRRLANWRTMTAFQWSDISSIDGSQIHDMEDFVEEYAPENPTISEPSLWSITIDTRGSKCGI